MEREIIGFIKKRHLKLRHGINTSSDIMHQKIEYGFRDLVEPRNDVVQPISAAMIFTPEKLLTIEKFPDNVSLESPELGKVIPYIGGHVDLEDKAKDNIETLRNAVLREVLEETEINLEQINLITREPIVIYAPSELKTAKHFAALWPTFIPREIKVEDGDIRKIWRYRNKSEIASLPNLTEWSEVLVDYLSNKIHFDDDGFEGFLGKLRQLIIHTPQKDAVKEN